MLLNESKTDFVLKITKLAKDILKYVAKINSEFYYRNYVQYGEYKTESRDIFRYSMFVLGNDEKANPNYKKIETEAIIKNFPIGLRIVFVDEIEGDVDGNKTKGFYDANPTTKVKTIYLEFDKVIDKINDITKRLGTKNTKDKLEHNYYLILEFYISKILIHEMNHAFEDYVYKKGGVDPKMDKAIKNNAINKLNDYPFYLNLKHEVRARIIESVSMYNFYVMNDDMESYTKRDFNEVIKKVKNNIMFNLYSDENKKDTIRSLYKIWYNLPQNVLEKNLLDSQ